MITARIVSRKTSIKLNIHFTALFCLLITTVTLATPMVPTQFTSRFERGEEPFCILLLDIDNFKQINDINGHACGDKVLIETSQLMRNQIRKQDLLARWGGEEFIMMIVETQIEQAQQITEKVRLAIHQNIIKYEDKNINISVTIGVSQILPTEKLDDCINRADKNLYLGKKDGRNIIISDT